MLLKSKEARMKSDESNHELEAIILNNIEQKINEAIADGKYKIECCGQLPYEIEKKLRGLGYKVKTTFYRNDYYYTIRW